MTDTNKDPTVDQTVSKDPDVVADGGEKAPPKEFVKSVGLATSGNVRGARHAVKILSWCG